MLHKKAVWLFALTILIVGVAVGTFLSRQKEPMKRRPMRANQDKIKIVNVQYKDISTPVRVSGPLAAYHKVELFSEVSGVLEDTARPFREGIRFKQGEILIHIDDRVYENSLLAQKSSLLNTLTQLLPDLSIDFPERTAAWESYLKAMDLHRPLPALPEPVNDKERYYIASRDIYSLFYQIKGMEATLEKYRLRAPFNGVVTASSINPGTLVRMGQKLGEFSSTELYEMETAVRLFDTQRIHVGSQVRLTSAEASGEFRGSVARINRAIDRDSMLVKVYVHLRDERLRDGMYLKGDIEAAPIPAVFTVSKDLLLPGDRILAVEDAILVSRHVEIVAEQGSLVLIRGIPEGTPILAEKREGLREGAPVPAIDTEAAGPPTAASSPATGR